MFNKKRIIGIIVIAMLALTAGYWGCSETDVGDNQADMMENTITNASSANESNNAIPDCQVEINESDDVTWVATSDGSRYAISEIESYITAEDDGVRTPTFLQENNGLGTINEREEDLSHWIDQALLDPGVQYEIAGWEGQGYSFGRAYSTVFTGNASPEGSTETYFVVVVDLVMVYMDGPYEKVAYVSYVDGQELGRVVVSRLLSFVDPDDLAFEPISIGFDENGTEVFLWNQGFAPYGWTGESAQGWCWGCWGSCVASNSISGCGAGAMGCVISGPGWGGCAAAVCGAAVGASMLGCAVSQWFF